VACLVLVAILCVGISSRKLGLAATGEKTCVPPVLRIRWLVSKLPLAIPGRNRKRPRSVTDVGKVEETSWNPTFEPKPST
jgi:hypothetical protein